MEYPFYFSPSTDGMYPVAMKHLYDEAGSWPEDGLPITQETYDTFNVAYPEGKKRGVVDGVMAWVDLPGPTQEQLVDLANQQKQAKITAANAIFLEWQTKLLLNMATEAQKQAVKNWVNYVDAVKAIDPNDAPDISWPEEPAIPDEAQ